MKCIYPESQEKGVVSILSVIFFIILMSVITVSFLRIVTDEQTQVIQDDLSKGALAAARSGVEDAKRALLLCRDRTGQARLDCDAALQVQTCPGIFASTAMQADLGLQVTADGSIRVGDPANNNNERYTCVTLNRDTPDYTGTMSEGLGDFIPLRGTGVFDQVRLSWHQTSVDGTGAVIPSTAINAQNPRRTEWRNGAGNSYIAMPRIQFMQFDSAQTLSAQTNSSSGTVLVPSTTGSSTVTVTSLTQNGMPKRSTVNCSTAQAGYLCTATFDLNFVQPATSQFFLFIKSFYNTPHYKVELLYSNNPVNFSDVQPQVDSTGAAANVYKRVLSRVTYQSDAFFTINAIEGGASVCKNFSITDDAFVNPCGDTLPAASGVPRSETGTTGSPITP